jgi:hypothetical protein
MDRNDRTESIRGHRPERHRRQQLRELLLAAADTARRGRVTQLAERMSETATRAVRDRVATLLVAVG